MSVGTTDSKTRAPAREGDVLLVEDSELDAERIARAFARLGVGRRVVRAHDGVEAIERLEERAHGPDAPFALMLLDLNMPRMNGLEVLEACAARPELDAPPALVMSTSAPTLERRAEALSPHERLVKPATVAETVSALAASDAVGPLVTRDDIVLVDDDPDVHELARRLVRRTPRRLRGLDGARAAREALAHREVELLIVDGRMPDGDGLSLIESLEAEGALLAGRTVLSSAGRLDGTERARADALGVEVIVKSELFDRRRFAEHVEARAA